MSTTAKLATIAAAVLLLLAGGWWGTQALLPPTFEEQYRLEDGVNLKVVKPPHSPSRNAWMHAQLRGQSEPAVELPEDDT